MSALVIAVLLLCVARCLHQQLAKLTMIFRRSAACIVHNCDCSNPITSCRGAAGCVGVILAGFCKSFILLILGESNIARRASPKTAVCEEMSQLVQRRDINLRRNERHVGAGSWIQHPTR